MVKHCRGVRWGVISQRHQAIVVDVEEEEITEAETNKRKSVPEAGELKG